MGQDDQDGKSQDSVEIAGDDSFDALRSLDIRTERRIFWRELVVLAITALLATVYVVALLFRPGVAPTPPL
jgi:hypothetical protein